MTIHCLHGFLGSGKDFDFMKEVFPADSISAPSLFAKNTSWLHPLKDFGKEYNKHVKEKSILVGYSLGGRLAMQALLEDESLYTCAVIVSSHTGLKSTSERLIRKEKDKALVEKLRLSFTDFIKEWDSLPLFKGCPPMQREDLDKKALEYALTAWSLGEQEDLKERIESLSIPLLFVAGEHDTVYRNLALSLHLKNPRSQVWIAEETTHRVPWQSKEKFVNKVKEFISGSHL